MSLYNEPALIERVGAAPRAGLGADNVVTSEPIMPSEDFGARSAAVLTMCDTRRPGTASVAAIRC